MIRPDLAAYLAVVSAGRPANVARMTALVGPATWYIAAGEAPAYSAAGAPAVVESGPLCRSRNAALDDAFARDMPCVQASDDLRSVALARVGPDGKPYAEPCTFAAALALLLGGIGPGDRARFAGCAPTANAFYYRPGRDVSASSFIVGDLVAVAPCGLRYDAAAQLKEDYDYTLQHLAAFGAVYRRNDVLAAFAHRTNPGGAGPLRRPGRERRVVAYLKAKWPGCFRDNPRRRDEVLLTWPPRPAPTPA